VHLCCAESAKQEKRKPGKTVLDKALEMKYILKKRRNV
jgi:rRNA pseudouridine-1189 N-methylase Emg1 (Nep1/Mra1 family)